MSRNRNITKVFNQGNPHHQERLCLNAECQLYRDDLLAKNKTLREELAVSLVWQKRLRNDREKLLELNAKLWSFNSEMRQLCRRLIEYAEKRARQQHSAKQTTAFHADLTPAERYCEEREAEVMYYAAAAQWVMLCEEPRKRRLARKSWQTIIIMKKREFKRGSESSGLFGFCRSERRHHAQVQIIIVLLSVQQQGPFGL
ncbi:uncharacterized protein V6R79_005110 [Siganus canaliculatus]